MNFAKHLEQALEQKEEKYKWELHKVTYENFRNVNCEIVGIYNSRTAARIQKSKQESKLVYGRDGNGQDMIVVRVLCN